MSLREMEWVIGQAIISDALRRGLLGHRRAELLKSFNFSEKEREFLLKIQADTFVEFAQAVTDYISSHPEEKLPPAATR